MMKQLSKLGLRIFLLLLFVGAPALAAVPGLPGAGADIVDKSVEIEAQYL